VADTCPVSWQDDVRESFERLREEQRYRRVPVTPEKRLADEAFASSLFIGLIVGMVLMVRWEFATPAELWLIAGGGLAGTVALGSARRWPAVARVSGLVLMASCAFGLVLFGAAFSSFTSNLG
jgi:hypothetical protein